MKETFALIVDIKNLQASAMYLEDELKEARTAQEKGEILAKMEYILMAIEHASKVLTTQTRKHIVKVCNNETGPSIEALDQMTLREATFQSFHPMSSVMKELQF